MAQNKARIPSRTHPLQYLIKRIMTDALEEHDGKVSIEVKNITNLWFADGIDGIAEAEQELEALVQRSRQNLNKV